MKLFYKLYWKILLLIAIIVVEFGVIAPKLISYDSDELVMIGFATILIVIFLLVHLIYHIIKTILKELK